jgi:hypothetical protein
MRAVDIGVGHDDDALIAQIVRVAVLARAAAERLDEVRDFLIGEDLLAVAEATFRILPRMGRIAWVLRSRACLAEPPALSPSTMKISVPAGSSALQSVSLPGRRSLRPEVAVLRLTSFSALRREALVHPLDHIGQQRLAALHIVGEEMVEMIAHRVFDKPLASGLVRRSLVWLWNCGSRMKTEHQLAAGHHIVRRDILRLLDARQLAEGADALYQSARTPASCVPPSGVGMVLQYQL